jgi:cytochrome c-type biogenesis protein CcmE
MNNNRLWLILLFIIMIANIIYMVIGIISDWQVYYIILNAAAAVVSFIGLRQLVRIK